MDIKTQWTLFWVRRKSGDSLDSALQDLVKKRALEPLLVLAQDRSPVGWSAIEALGRLAHPRSVPILIERLRSDDGDAQFHAADVLGAIGDRSASEALVDAVLRTNAKYQTTKSAKAALGRLGSSAVKAVARLLQSGDAEARRYAAGFLRVHPDPSVIGMLATALHDEEGLVRYYAACTLAVLGDERGIHELVQQCESGSGELAVTALQQLGTPRALEALTRLLRGSRSLPAVVTALKALGWVPRQDTELAPWLVGEGKFKAAAEIGPASIPGLLDNLSNHEAYEALKWLLEEPLAHCIDTELLRRLAAIADGINYIWIPDDDEYGQRPDRMVEIPFSCAPLRDLAAREQLRRDLSKVTAPSSPEARSQAEEKVRRAEADKTAREKADAEKKAEEVQSQAEKKVNDANAIGRTQEVGRWLSAKAEEAARKIAEAELRLTAAESAFALAKSIPLTSNRRARLSEKKRAKAEDARAAAVGEIRHAEAVLLAYENVLSLLMQSGGTDDASTLLAEALCKADDNVRWILMDTLAFIGDHGAITVLVKELSEGNRASREHAVSALKRINTVESIEPLIAHLTKMLNYENDVIRRLSVEALEGISHPHALAALFEALQNRDGYVRKRAVWTLSQTNTLPTVERLLPNLARMVHDEDPEVRYAVVMALAHIGGRHAIEILCEAFRDEVSTVRQKAVEMALTFTSDLQISGMLIAHLTKTLRDVDSEVRFEAVEALGRIGSQHALESVLEASKDRSKKVRQNVIHWIFKDQFYAQNIGLLVTHIRQMLHDEDSEVRIDGIEALRVLASKAEGLANYPQVIMLLENTLDDNQNEEVIKKAGEILHDYCVNWQPSKKMQGVLWVHGLKWWPRWYQHKFRVLAAATVCIVLAITIASWYRWPLGPPTGQEYSPTPTEQEYAAGNLDFSREDFASAAAHYSRALDFTPDYKAAALKRGMTQLARQEFAAALVDYALALQIDPSYADAYFARGTLYWISGRIDDAAVDYAKAIEFAPDEKFYYDRLATALYEGKRDGEVTEVYRRAFEADGRRAWALWGWLSAIYATDDMATLESVCERLRNEGVVSAALSYHVGLVAWKHRDYWTAARSIEEALGADPEQVPSFAYRILWEAYKNLGDIGRREKYRNLVIEKTSQDPEDSK